MDKQIRLLMDWDAPGGQRYTAGTFLSIPEVVAQDLLDTKIAVEQTVEQYEAEQAKEAKRKAIADLEKRRESQFAGVKVVRDAGDNIDPKGGFRDIGHMAYAIWKAGPGGAHAPETLRKWSDTCIKAAGSDEHRSDISALGGFLVPSAFRAELLAKQMETAVVRPRAQVIPMETNSVAIPYINETTRSTAGTTRGGIAMTWTSQVTQRTGSKTSLGLLTLNLHTLYGLCYVTNELMEDSPLTLGAILPARFAESLAFEEDYYYIWGNGGNQPLGVMSAACLISQAAETGQAATTIVAENILKMWSRLAPESMGRAVWLCAPDCFPQLATMAIKVGTGGCPVWLPANQSIAGAPNGTIFGRPLIISEKCATLGTTGDIILADFGLYLIGQKANAAPEIASSIHLRFDYNETAFRLELRTDGQPAWSSALTPRSAGATLSPFVCVATRS